MRTLLIALIVALISGCSNPTQTQPEFVWPKTNETFEWPDHPSSEVFKALLKAYNQDDLKALKNFVKTYYPTDKSKGKELYWRQIFSEYGTLKPFKVDEHKFHGLPAIWFQGQSTKSWVKMVIMTNKTGDSIKRVGVFRKMRPTGELPPYQLISTSQLPHYLDGYLNQLSEQERFSGSVLIAKGDSVIYQNSVGFNNKAKQIINKATSIFPIASTTKVFTATAIAQLIEANKLALTDPISNFIPSYPKDIADQVTIKHLLTHTSGIEFDDYDPFYYDTIQAKNLDEMVKLQIKYIDHMNEGRRPNFKPLDKFDYSNDGYVLLGAIIEKVSGQSYGEYINQFIFEPSGMKNSIAINAKYEALKNKPKKYSYNNREMRFQGGARKEAIGSAVSSIIMPANGIYSSVSDLYKFFKALNQGRLVKAEIKEDMFGKHATQISSKAAQHHIYYGYGLMTRVTGKAVSIGHGGTDFGVGSSLEYFPEQDMYVIVLSNFGAIAANIVSEHIRDLLQPNYVKQSSN